MDIPKILIDFVTEGRAILFLGSGAIVGCQHPDGLSPPTSKELAGLLAERFLGKEFAERSLQQVAELAISETNLLEVQGFIADLFKDFNPSEFQKLVPKFVWSMIATTNFDLIVERAYEQVKNPLQKLTVFKKNGERIEERIRAAGSLQYLKLHGCITDINDLDVPLILTPDQYVTHMNGRNRIFERFLSFAYEYPVIFVGHSLGDLDIRGILLKLEDLEGSKPRSYVVAPHMTAAEVRFWEGKKITTIESTFEEFLVELNGKVPAQFRVLSTAKEQTAHPIYDRFGSLKDAKPSDRLLTLLTRDLEYVHKGIKPKDINPKAFYKGYFVDWSPIVHDLDVPRTITENVLSEVFLSTEDEKLEQQELYVIRGHAGAGKSVILGRLAWDAAIHFNKLCLKANLSSYLEYEPLAELYRNCGERIFLFIDPLSDFNEIIEIFLLRAQEDELPLTIIGAERPNEWNIQCENLESFVTDFYEVRYLSEKEIGELITYLERYKSLGHLEDLDAQERFDAFAKRAGRQLLVALHEATLGKPFEDIVHDEYQSITSQRAKSLYLSVCIFSMLGVPIRAGLISRVHSISFAEFKERLFEPLEFIVFTRLNEIIQDYEYRARHPHIAEMVFERVLSDPEDRFHEIVRVLDSIDIDFSSDMDAFKGLLNARRLLNIFADPQMIRQVFEIAHARDPDNPKMLQQEAIFEMNSTGGSLNRASTLLEKAHALAPYYKPITHSLSVLALRRSETAKNELEKRKFRDDSKKLANELISEGAFSPHPFHTFISIGMEELKDLLKEGDERSIEGKINEIEKTISKSQQNFPDDGHLLDAIARFNQLLNQETKAIAILEKAYRRNARNPYIASRLATLYEVNERIEDAVRVLRGCIDANPGEKMIHFRLGMLLSKIPGSSGPDIRHHLRRSFTEGDSNFTSQFWYARWNYLAGEFEEANRTFSRLGIAKVDNRVRQKPRGIVYHGDEPSIFGGSISKLEANFAFIQRDEFQDRIFTHRKFSEGWNALVYGMRVKFNLGFNYRGPIAQNVTPES